MNNTARVIAAALTSVLFGSFSGLVQAQGPSDASAVSAVPIAISVVAPLAVLSAGATLTVIAIESTARGTTWVLQRASDGVKVSVRFAGRVVDAAAFSVGTVVVVSAIATGFVFSAAGQALAFIPNEIGASLLYNATVTQHGLVTP